MVCSENDINPIIKLPICGRKIKLRTKQSRQGFFRYISYVTYDMLHMIIYVSNKFFEITLWNVEC